MSPSIKIAIAVMLTLGGCASERQPAAQHLQISGATPVVCCCGKGPGYYGRAATTRPMVASAATTRPFGPGPGYGRGMGRGPGGPGFRGGMQSGGMQQAMMPIHSLLDQHQLIQRDVKEIEGGVAATTTSQTPAVAEMIRTHTKQMKERLERGEPIRMWDPLFVELFKHHDKIKMTITDVPGGVRVVETSDDPQVTLLIRQHANHGVSEFVARGYDRAHEASPLPTGYAEPSR